MIKLDEKLFKTVDYSSGYDTFIQATTPPNCFGEVLSVLIAPAYNKPGHIEIYTFLDFKERNPLFSPDHPHYYPHAFANSKEPEYIRIESQLKTDSAITFLVNRKAWEVAHVRERVVWLESNPTKNSIDYFYYCKKSGIPTDWEPNNNMKEVTL